VFAIRLLTHGLSIYIVLIAAFGLGAMKPLFDAAAYRALPSVVDDELLARANGYMEAAIAAGDETVGRALGGVLYALATSVPIIGDAASFAASALLLRSLPPDAPIIDASAPRTTLRADMAAGLRWFVRNRLIRLLAGMVGFLALAQSMVFAVIVLIAQRRLGLSAKGFGLFFGTIAIGGIVGNLVAASIEARIGQLRLILGAIVVVAAGYLVTWSTTSVVVASAALAIEVAATRAASVVIVTIRQRVIPRALIGRVSNVARTFTWGALPIGSALGGVLAHRFGVRSTLLVASALTLAVGIVGGPLLARHIETASGAAA
jgi:predicted MFS family arabinose efflux permease